MKTDIQNIKLNIANDLYDNESFNKLGISLNDACDDIIVNYFSYYLLSNNKKTNFSFSEFLKKESNIDSELREILVNNTVIFSNLNKSDFSIFSIDSFTIAKFYETVKSTKIFSDSSGLIKCCDSLDYRKSCGMFFTPREIVKFIVTNTIKECKNNLIGLIKENKIEDAIKNFLNLRIVDISCGTGSFLTVLVEELIGFREELMVTIGEDSITEFSEYCTFVDTEKFIKHVITRMVYGVDIDKNAILLCSCNLLNFIVKNDLKSISIFDLNIKHGDSLTGHISNGKNSNIKTNYYDNPIQWEHDFNHVFKGDNPGFDAVIMNPPYGKVRLESNKGHNRGKQITDEQKHELKQLSHFFRKSGHYKLSINGVQNFYKLMIERALNLLAKNAAIGFIVPNTLLCDKSTTLLRKYLLDKMKTEVIVDIPENSDFFEDITQSFCILIASSGKSESIKFWSEVKRKKDLDINKYDTIDVNFIRETFPDVYLIPIIDSKGYSVFKKIHSYGKLKDYSFIRNSRGEVDLTKYSKLITTNRKGERLIRGNDIKIFKLGKHENKKPGFIDGNSFKEEIKNSAKLYDIGVRRIICKQISNLRKSKRLEFAMIEPDTIIANSCNYILVDKEKDSKLFLNYLLGYLNSSLAEWRFRITSTNNHINNYELDDMPLIIPNENSDKWDTVKKIAEKSKEAVFDSNVKFEKIFSFIDSQVFKLFDFNMDEIEYILKSIGKDDNYISIVISNLLNTNEGVQNHVTGPLGEREMKMVLSIPPGGNWKNIPLEIKDKRVDRIRKTGGRTTYYGRLRWNHPSYTINTFFNRTGNGCFIHPEQDRLISLREAARLQSFPDNFIFYGTKTSMYHQIGNAVPPLLARALGAIIDSKKYADLFCGAGGFSLGLEQNGSKCVFALDHEKHCIETFKKNHNICSDNVLCTDIKSLDLRDTFSTINNVDLVIGGPPCQGFSTAGKYLLDDPRNELVKYYIRSIDIIQPECFIMENVKGLTFFKKGEIVNEIYEEFKKIGYSVQHKVLLAAEYGVPQLRERVFFIGRKDNRPIYFPRPLFSEDNKNLPNFITVKDAISDMPPLKAGEGIMGIVPYPTASKTYYQSLMRGEKSFDDFYLKVLDKYNINGEKNSREAVLTLDMY